MTEAVEFTSPEAGCVPGMDKAGVSGHILTEAGLRGPTYSGSAPWSCFHCVYVAETREEGLLHFGRAEDCTPICGVAAETYRQMEQAVWEYRNECDATSKTFYSLGAEHQTKLREAEQAGYDRGLADGLALTGNLTPSTTGISDPSSEIDHAILSEGAGE